MKAWLFSVVLSLHMGASAMTADLVFQRQINGKCLSLYGEDDHQLFALQYCSSDRAESCRVIWMKVEVFIPIRVDHGGPSGEAMRLRVLDVTEHSDLVWVLYSILGKMQIDVVEPGDRSSKTIATLPMFEQVVPGATAGRLCTAGKFLVRDDKLLAELEMAGAEARREQWRITKDSAEQVVEVPASHSSSDAP